MRPVINQWAPYLNQIQATPEAAFQALITTEQTLRNGSPSQKQQMIMRLAHDYGIDLNGITATNQDQQQQQATQVHPDMQHAVQRVQHLEQYIQNMEYNRKQKEAEKQEKEMSYLQDEVSKFKSSPDAPHFDAVSADMANLLKAGIATDLKDAYDRACYMQPDIRASLEKAAEAKRIQERANLANKAKAKDISITGSPSGASVPIAGASIRADLEAAFRGAANRV